MDSSAPHRPRRFHWYIRQKLSPPDLQACKTEPSTSSDDLCDRRKASRSNHSIFGARNGFRPPDGSNFLVSCMMTLRHLLFRRLLEPSLDDDLSEYRLCGGGVSAKYLSNIIVIAVIQEISCGLVFATHNADFFHDPQRILLATCRIIQFVPCFMALLGNYRNNALLSIPFMISQTLVGSYADIHTWLMLISEWRESFSPIPFLTTPFTYLVIPLIAYSCLLCAIIYVQYKAVQFVSVKKLSLNRVAADETVIESLM